MFSLVVVTRRLRRLLWTPHFYHGIVTKRQRKTKIQDPVERVTEISFSSHLSNVLWWW